MKSIKLLAFFAAAATISVSCGGSDTDQPEPPKRGNLLLTASKDAITSNGTDAVTFNVEMTEEGGEKIDVTGQATIYLAGKDALPSNSFTTEMEGSYRFYAAYGPNVSNDITIKAMPEVPELPADPNPASTDFAHRHLVIQHTGTDCGYCPYMMSALAQLAQDSEYSSQYCLAASHSYNTSDPMYSALSKNIGRLYGTGSYPYISMDLNKNLGVNNSSVAANVNNLKKLLDNNAVATPEAGITAAVSATSAQIIINASVKAAVTGSYRVGAWILEDKINAMQYGAQSDEHNIHNNAVRAAAGNQSILTGTEIGTIEAGKTGNIVQTINIDRKWKIENCKVLIFVTNPDADKQTPAKNCIVCPIGGSVAFEYK